MARRRPDAFRTGFAVRGSGEGVIKSSVYGNEWFVDTAATAFGSGKSPDAPATTMAAVLAQIGSNDVIYIRGNVLEQVAAPLIFDVTIIGAATRPRHSDSSSRTSASWRPVASEVATTPLLTIQAQGWRIIDVLFDAPSDAACVSLKATAADDNLIDASHFEALGCKFANGLIGVEDNGGACNYRIEGCTFANLTSAIKCISTGVRIPLQNQILRNRFIGNTNDCASSQSYSLIEGNRFMTAGSGATNKVVSTTYNSVQGGNNSVVLNTFCNSEAEIAPGSGYTGAASDLWMNYINSAAALAYGQPA